MCEDAVVISDNYVAVVDGSTSKSPLRIDPLMSDGRLCMLTVSAFIRTMAPDISVEAFCRGVTTAVRNVYLSRSIDINRLRTNPTHRMAASTVVYSRHRQELWMIGDCQCIVGGHYYDNPKPYEERVAAIRADFIRKALAEGGKTEDFQTIDAGRQACLDELILACQEQNKSFAVIDGFDIPLEHVKVINAEPNTEIILASDGYAFLYPTLRESEEALKQQLATDPLCVNSFIATKGLMKGRLSFDDRAYVRFV